MVCPVYTCLPESTIRDVVKEMSARSVSSVVVIDREERPVGIMRC